MQMRFLFGRIERRIAGERGHVRLVAHTDAQVRKRGINMHLNDRFCHLPAAFNGIVQQIVQQGCQFCVFDGQIAVEAGVDFHLDLFFDKQYLYLKIFLQI